MLQKSKRQGGERVEKRARTPRLWQEDGEQSGTEKYAVAIIYLVYVSTCVQCAHADRESTICSPSCIFHLAGFFFF